MAVTKKKYPGALGEVAAGLRHRKEGDSEAAGDPEFEGQAGDKERQWRCCGDEQAGNSHIVVSAGKQSKHGERTERS